MQARSRIGLWLALMWPAMAAPQAEADLMRQHAVLERLVGIWDVTVQVKRPKELVVTYTEVTAWAPGKRLLRSETGVKPDGSQDWSMMVYDQASGGYPLWIFSSTGAWYYFAPGQWDEAQRSIEWKSLPLMPLSYVMRCVFADARTRHCSTLVKSWTGAVLLEQDYTARRREP